MHLDEAVAFVYFFPLVFACVAFYSTRWPWKLRQFFYLTLTPRSHCPSLVVVFLEFVPQVLMTIAKSDETS